MKNWIGKSLLLIGILHTIFGLVVFSGVFIIIIREGLFNTIDGQPIKEAAFWYLASGFALILFAICIDTIERRSIPIPLLIKWSFSILTMLGCILMPKSGFWLLILPAIGLINSRAQKKSRKRKKAG